MQILARNLIKLQPSLRPFLSSPHFGSGTGLRTISSSGVGFVPTQEPHSKPAPFSSPSLLKYHHHPINFSARFSHQLAEKILANKKSPEQETKPYKLDMYATQEEEEKKEAKLAETLEQDLSLEQQLRWGFIKKVYGIVAGQLALTTAVASATVFCSPIHQLFFTSPNVTFSIMGASLLSLVPLHVYKHKHPLNMICLGTFTTLNSLMIGACCAAVDGKIVLETLGLTSAAVCSLTGYTFWAARKGKDFSYLGPILFPSLIVLTITSLLHIFFPLGGGPTSVGYSAIGALIFSGYIVYDTDRLIKHFDYDDYIPASISLYLHIMNLFLKIMEVLAKLNKKR